MNVLIACLMIIVSAHLVSTKSLLPHPVRQRDAFRSRVNKHRWVQLRDMPKSFSLDYVEFKPYENLPFRRLKYYDFDTETPVYSKPKKHNYPLEVSSRNINKKIYKNKRLEPDTKYDDLFDENGMLFLTQPVDLEDRELNKLMNKVVEYGMHSKKNKFLRNPPTKVFKSEEVNKLKKIVRALDEEEPANMKTEYEFSELVQ